MIIKLNEATEHTTDTTVDQLNPATNEVEIYWAERGEQDKTFIFKSVFKKTPDHETTGAWLEKTLELVGWHYGEPDSKTGEYIGNLGGQGIMDFDYSKEEFGKALTKDYYGTDFIKIVEK